ncbi:MAG: Gfo/Idh/MocA family protein [Burkholderiales bacterium]
MNSRFASVVVGLIGAGNVVETYHLPVLSRLPSVRIGWIADANLSRAEALAVAYGIPWFAAEIDCLPDVNAVLVATPVGTRWPIVEAVTGRGWHAFCEKPFAISSDEHRRMIDLARARHTRLGVGLLRRHYAGTDAARKAIRSGILGAVLDIFASEGMRVRKTGRGDNWYQTDAAASGGGALFEIGAHLVDQVFAICNVEGFEIDDCRQEYLAGLEFETRATGELRMRGGDRVHFSITVTRLRDVFNGIIVRCANGQLRLGLAPDSGLEILDRSGNSILRMDSPVRDRAALYAAVRAEWEGFLGDIHASDQDLKQATAFTGTEFIEACYKLGAQARVPEPRDGR